MGRVYSSKCQLFTDHVQCRSTETRAIEASSVHDLITDISDRSVYSPATVPTRHEGYVATGSSGLKAWVSFSGLRFLSKLKIICKGSS